MPDNIQPVATGSPVRRMGRWLGWLLVLLLGVYLGIGALVALVMSRPRRSIDKAVSPATLQLAFDEVRFPARGADATIAAWYLPHPTSHRAVIMVHGKDSSRFREYFGQGPKLAAGLLERDLSVLMIDLRGHGESSDARFSFGINEQRDVLGAVDFLREHGTKSGSIGLLGASMGAATSLFAAAAEPAIGAVVEDCGYAEFEPLVTAAWHHSTGLPELFIPSTFLFSRLFLGVDLQNIRPISVVSQIAPRPVLIIHSEEDQTVPVSHAGRLQKALPSAELWLIPGAGHVAGYRVEPAAYLRRVGDFFDGKLPK